MNKSDKKRDKYMLEGPLAKNGYDWWWHSFTGYNKETKKEQAFFIEFFVCNPKRGGANPVFGQIKENIKLGIKPSYVMVKVGTWGEDAKQLHGFYGIDQLQVAKNKLDLKVGECILTETETKGEVSVVDSAIHPEYMSDNGRMKWDLKINKKVAFHVGVGAASFFRKINAFKMFWHAEGMKTEYEGKLIFDGMEYEVIPEKSYGYADKNWGGDFTSPWVWLSSCNLTSRVTGEKLENTVFNSGGGCPIVLGIPLKRKLLSLVHYEGTDYEFNFSRIFDFVKTDFYSKETDTKVLWHVESKTKKNLMIIDCVCEKKDMLLVNYESPDGKKRHNRLWNGGTGKGRLQLYEIKNKNRRLIDDCDFSNAGCEYGEYTD